MTDFGAPKKKRGGLSWLLWWRISPFELQDNVKNYKTMKIYQSARGVSFLLFLASAVMTALVTELDSHDRMAYIDAGLFLFLGLFILLGHRWAMIIGMTLWTLDKALQIVGMFQGHFINPIGSVLFWCIYMHAMFLAYRVEQARRAAPTTDATVFN